MGTPCLPSATKLRRLCFYRCVSIHRGVPAQVHPLGPGAPPGTRYTPRDQVHPSGPGTPGTRYTPPGPGTPPRTRYPPDQVHPPNQIHIPGPGPPPDRATAADGMHPTGMHSCLRRLLVMRNRRLLHKAISAIFYSKKRLHSLYMVHIKKANWRFVD